MSSESFFFQGGRAPSGCQPCKQPCGPKFHQSSARVLIPTAAHYCKSQHTQQVCYRFLHTRFSGTIVAFPFRSKTTRQRHELSQKWPIPFYADEAEVELSGPHLKIKHSQRRVLWVFDGFGIFNLSACWKLLKIVRIIFSMELLLQCRRLW